MKKLWGRRVTRILAVPVVLGLLGVLLPWAWVIIASVGRVHDATEVADAPETPVALVLGAGLQGGRPSPFLGARLDAAKELYDGGKVKVLLVSGDNRTHAYDEPTAMRDYLVAAGVPTEAIVLDFAGRDTYDSCQRAHRIFGVDKVTVISQGYHVGRAVALCRAAGMTTDGVGDTSMRERYPREWWIGWTREKLANIKAVGDVVTGRDPVLGQPETSVQDALANGAR
ncbi:conserved membrane-associated protein (OmpA family protein) [Janibacter sp. HTCC2649]|uniref:SanA/YdcF family protein n=1 Tax=Janibacter sp. HTCC2649 TaxID=313589 RepID=UPI0000670861|nr:ElyC/SanA/YdcF family protein [Janibacter sp. HTCC2649]EAQ00306.1 conserved membrane-associated protein (OmpA family protein) [Janibacter sp. HTCC2649]